MSEENKIAAGVLVRYQAQSLTFLIKQAADACRSFLEAYEELEKIGGGPQVSEEEWVERYEGITEHFRLLSIIVHEVEKLASLNQVIGVLEGLTDEKTSGAQAH